MFQSVLRTSVRATTARRVAYVRPSYAFRALSSTAIRRSGGAPPVILGEGAKPGEVPTDENQSTGLERLQILGNLEGVDVFDHEPLDASRIGTPKDPIKVFSLDTERLVGCSGSPADSHDVIWFNVTTERQTRCPECGSAYAIDFHGDSDAHHHDHGHH